MDFGKVIKILGGIIHHGSNIAKVLKEYERNKDEVEEALKKIEVVFDRPEVVGVPPPGGGIVLEPAPAPPLQPPVPDDRPMGELYPQVYHKLFLPKNRPFFCVKKKDGIYSKELFEQMLSPAGPMAQMKGDNMHFNIDVFDENGDHIPEENAPKGPDGRPVLRYRWTYDGHQMNDSGQDRFSLNSEYDGGGATPNLKLEEPSPGRHECTFMAYVPAEYNGGTRVESNVVTWYAD